MNTINSLRFHLFPGRAIGDVPYRRIHARSYQAWRRTWREEFRLIDSKTEVGGDPFTRADAIGVLTDGEFVGGLVLCFLHDFSLPAYRDQSGVRRLFTDEFIEGLMSEGRRVVMTLEHLTVVPEWRKSFTGLPFGHVLAALGLEIFPYSGAECVAASTRNSRGMNETASSLGFQTRSVKAVYGEDSDLMVFDARARQKLSNERVESLLDVLWRERLDHTNWTASQGVVRVA